MNQPQLELPSLLPETLNPFSQNFRPYVQIIEQPSKSLRYRYISEGRPSTISGASSTKGNKLPFRIAVVGYTGKVAVVVSCVTKDHPYKPHPHNLVGDHCKKGLYTLETEISDKNNTVTFAKLRVQCTKRNEVKEALRIREEKKIDPFSTGFSHKDDVKSIDLNAVRLCFQVFLREERKNIPLTPVVSDPINNNKKPDPVIHRLSHCNSYADGRKEDIILLCTKISKDDIRIRFFEKQNNQIVWEDFGTFHPNHVYNNTSICFKPPRYHDPTITDPVRVMVQLVRPSDGCESPSIAFEYLPQEAELGTLKEKRKKYNHYDELYSNLIESFSNKETPKVIAEFENAPIYHELTKVEENSLLDSPWPQALYLNLQETPNTFNNIDQCVPSTSRRSTPSDLPSWNIPDDLLGNNDVNFESASGICQVLNIEQIELAPIHISSGDLEMTDVDKLSGSLLENLVM